MDNCRKFKWSVTLTLDQVKVMSAYTACMLNHVTVASRTTEIWPFEFRQISILEEVWTLVIAFLDGNSKIGLRQAVVQVPYYGHQPSVLMAEEIDLEKCTFCNFGSSLTLTLDRVEVTLVRICGRGLPTHQIRWKSGKLLVDVQTDTPEFQSTRSSVGDDLKKCRFITTCKTHN